MADWCSPCKILAPTLDKLSEEIGIEVVKINIDADENATLVSQYQIRSVPTLVLVKDQATIATKSGNMPYGMLKSWVEANTPVEPIIEQVQEMAA